MFQRSLCICNFTPILTISKDAEESQSTFFFWFFVLNHSIIQYHVSVFSVHLFYRCWCIKCVLKRIRVQLKSISVNLAYKSITLLFYLHHSRFSPQLAIEATKMIYRWWFIRDVPHTHIRSHTNRKTCMNSSCSEEEQINIKIK